MGCCSEVMQVGYDECFICMWEFYFVYCEGGFCECLIGDVQMLLMCLGCCCVFYLFDLFLLVVV